MEMTSRQKDKRGLQRYGIDGGDMECLQDQRIAGSASKNEVTGISTIMVGSYLFSSDDNGDTWTGPHLGKPDLDCLLKRGRVRPVWVPPKAR